MKIGFVGLGRMGFPIARNLLRAGHELVAYNRSRDKAEAAAKEGMHTAATPAEAAHGADAVVSMLADDPAVADVTFGEHGIAAGLATGAAHIGSSTISVNLARRLAAEHGKRQQAYVSAPVFGRPDAAEAKKLVVAVAGESHVIERYQPLFDAIGRRTFVAGSEPWQANTVKLNGNFMIASVVETFAEAFATMRKAGIDRHLFLDIMNELFQSPVYKIYGGAIVAERFDPALFALKLGLKDVRLALEAAQELGVPMPFASILRDHMLSAVANGQGDLDWSSLALVAARSAGLERFQETVA